MEFFKELTNRAPIRYKKGMITIAEQFRREGKIEGKREGQMVGQKQMIQKLAQSRLSLDFIAKHTGLSIATVNQLVDQLD